MKPPVSILNRKFEYTPSVKTDIRKTFARIREQIQKEKECHASSRLPSSAPST